MLRFFKALRVRVCSLFQCRKAGPREVLEEVKAYVDAEIKKSSDPHINKSTIKPEGGMLVLNRPDGRTMYIWATAREIHTIVHGRERVTVVERLKMCCSKPEAADVQPQGKACFDYQCRLDKSAETHLRMFLRGEI